MIRLLNVVGVALSLLAGCTVTHHEQNSFTNAIHSFDGKRIYCFEVAHK